MKKVMFFIKPFIKRYDLLIIFGILSLIYCIVEYYFFFPIVLGASFIRGGSVLESIIYIIQLVINNFLSVRYLLYGVIAIIISGLVFGFVFSGTFYTLNNFLLKKAKMKFEFLKGVKLHFLRVSLISVCAILYAVLFVIFMVIVSIPAIVVTIAFIDGDFKLLGVAVAFVIITFIILFFGSMFFRMYVMFWYPSAFSFKGKIFAIGKMAADTFFWKIVVVFMMFDIVFWSFQFLLIYLNSLMAGNYSAGFIRFLVLILLNWVFKTIYFISLSTFVFSRFLIFKKRIVSAKD
ncbi:UNVERIFIED_CONTAM: hypothetical protein Cloal_1715 [Acetivibrio alkalicellulosi]